jgi:hypothetical protein
LFGDTALFAGFDEDGDDGCGSVIEQFREMGELYVGFYYVILDDWLDGKADDDE